MAGGLVAAALVALPLGGQTAEFASCLSRLRSAAAATGVTGRTFDQATAGITPDESVIAARASQPEFTTPIWDYLALLVDDQRIGDGRAKLAEWDTVLARVERRWGVDRHTVVAVWGVESDFGRILGGRPLVRSLATGACLGGRRDFSRRQLLATLRILQDGDIPAEQLTGSWAGAFGQTQFMPTTFLRLAVDGDGDGRRDIVGSVPDALASTANYLKQGGWRPDEPWGYEVRLPPAYRGVSGRTERRTLAQWARAGIRSLDGTPPRGPDTAALLLPAGRDGPAFLVFRNFDVIHSYNAAESYALAIAHLADRLRGGGPFATPWPTDDRGLSRAERSEVQRLLADRGYDVGPVDGVLGSKSRAAIKAFQADIGLDPTGRAGGLVLDALRNAASSR